MMKAICEKCKNEYSGITRWEKGDKLVCTNCQPAQKEGVEKSPDRLLRIISEVKGKPKIELLLLLLQEMGGMLHHLESIGTKWGAEIKEDRVAESMQYYLEIVEKIKSLILQEYAKQ